MTKFTCAVGFGDDWWRTACDGLPCYAECKGKRYCVLHFPGEDKHDEFKKVVRKKLEEGQNDFRGTYFPKSMSRLFESHEFFGSKADFSGAVFNSKESADFIDATFNSDVDFSAATFNDSARFRQSQFNGRAEFWRTKFCSGADFALITFNDTVRFDETTFEQYIVFVGTVFNANVHFEKAIFAKDGDVDFDRAIFRGSVRFMGGHRRPDMGGQRVDVFSPESKVSFAHAQIEQPNLFLFQTVLLRPHWFINVDSRQFAFTDIKWHGLPYGFEDAIEALELRGEEVPYRLLSKTCRELSINADEHRDFATANEFHYWSMQAQRKEMLVSDAAPWRLIWWYWALNGYSERPIRAAVWLMSILVGFAALYMFLHPVGVPKASQAGFVEAAWASIIYSLGVMTRLANDIPQNASLYLRSCIILEGVLGPLQIALFALALRRRFMR